MSKKSKSPSSWNNPRKTGPYEPSLTKRELDFLGDNPGTATSAIRDIKEVKAANADKVERFAGKTGVSLPRGTGTMSQPLRDALDNERKQ